MRNKNFYSVEEYFKKGTYVIPYYQRGYKWSLGEEGKTSLDKLLEDLKKAFLQNPDQDYHLQGITVQKEEGKYILVDGQQRTTSLFLILLYLSVNHEINISELIGNKNEPRLEYKVRKSVEDWIKTKYSAGGIQSSNAEEQDITALEKAWEMIARFFNETDESSSDFVAHKDFANFVLEKVKIIFVVLNTDPEKVFSMMNKDKAVMTQTDLVKAKLLSEASRQAFADLDTHEDGSHEWQINHLRSHFAREWDAWRKWWECDDVQDVFGGSIGVLTPPLKDKKPNEPKLNALLNLYWHIYKEKDGSMLAEELTHKNLLEEFSRLISDQDQAKKNKRIEAVETFDGLRQTQKILEEWFDNPVIYNWIGLMKFGSAKKLDIEIIVSLIMAYKRNKSPEIFENKYRNISIPKADDGQEFSAFPIEDIYHNSYELAAQQLLRRNIQMLNSLRLKFQFSMYEAPTDKKMRSLEHIHAQKHFFNQEEAKSGDIDKKLGNSIGNLVILPKGINSAVGCNSFKKKKEIIWTKLFEPEESSEKLANPSLFLHTLKLFSGEKWEEDDIEKNRSEFIENYKAFYK